MLVFTSMVWAQQRPFADVAEIATTHLAGEKWQGHKISATPIHRAPATGQVVRSSEIMSSVAGINADNEAFYVYLDGSSFVIVSADERMEPVLAYSTKNGFEVNNIPSNVRGYLGRYVKAFKQLGEVEKSTTKLQTKSGLRKAITGNVEPLVQTQWNQDEPFNNLCPVVNSTRTVTGCVATAMSQAMSVYKYPDCGTGVIDYTTYTHKIHITDDLANYPLDWNNMLTDYNGNYSTVQGDAVANLLYACGISIEMDYCPSNEGGSGAYSTDVIAAGIEKFGYDEDMYYANMDAMPIEDWHLMVTNNLRNGYPVIYSGRNEYNEGHSFLIDGFTSTDTDPFYHVNWGWGGWCDGEYKLLHLSPEHTGIGGGMGDFNIGNSAILGFKPDDAVVENGGFIQASQISVSPDVMSAGATGIISFEGLYNYGARNFTGSVIAYLVDMEGGRTELGRFNVNGLPFMYGWSAKDLTFTLPSTCADGTYYIEVCYKPQDMSEQPVYCGNGNPLLYVGCEPEPFDPDLMVTDLGTTFSGDRTVDMYASDLLNISERTFTGKVKMAIADIDGNIIADFGSVLDVQSLPYLNGFTNPQHFNGDIPSDLADGNYRLYLIAQQAGYTNWAKVTKFTLVDGYLQQFHLPCYADVRIENGKIWINEDDLPEFYADLQTTSFTLIGSNEGTRDVSTSVEQICNFGNTPFTGQISLCVTDVQGSVISVFGTPFTLTSPLNHFSYLIDSQTISGQAPSDLPDGEYLLQLAAKQNGCRGWSVLRKYVLSDGYITNYNLENGIPFWVVNGQMTFTEPAPTDVKVTNITLNTTSAELYVGEIVQLSATVSPDNATNKAVVWTSSNTEVATVSDAGLVTAIALGNATITATAADGSDVTATCAIVVSPVYAKDIVLNQNTFSGHEGEQVQLVATVLPENTTNKGVTWASSNTAVATVSETGLVTINALGEAVITATTVDGSNLTATCDVLGIGVLVDYVGLNVTSATLHVGETLQLEAMILPEDATIKDVIWTSNNTDVATVSEDGLVTAIALGTVDIMATAADGSRVAASCAIIVSPILVESIELNYDETEIHLGETLQLEATVLPENAENKTVSWESYSPNIASVDENGLVTAMNEGTTTIVATAQDGSDVSGCCYLTVLEVDGVLNIVVDDAENIKIYSPDGKRLEKQRTGVNIIRNADGAVKKVFKK